LLQVELVRGSPSVSGTVSRATAPIKGAFITVRKDNVVVARTVTDSDGKYELYLSDEEEYIVKVTTVETGVVSSLAKSITTDNSDQSTQTLDIDFATDIIE
jgi:hypothetical protein